MPSIVTLLPSATEIVCAIGLKDELVGISHECDHPEGVKGLPVVSRAKIDASKPSAQIDRDVREVVKAGLSIYEIDTELLEKLSPDVIVTQDQCEVCAVSLKDVEKAVCEITKKDTQICTLNPNCLDDIRDDFLRVGRATDRIKEANDLIAAFDQQLRRIEAIPATSIPRVLLIEWLAPPMIAGGWMPEILRLAGGEPLLVSSPKRFETFNWQQIRAAEADMAIIMPCGFSVERTLKEMEDPEIQAAIESLNIRTYVVDGNAYFNRPGPRIADSCEILWKLMNGKARELGKDVVRLYQT